MYFTGTITIDPSSPTEITTREPRGLFNKIASRLSGGSKKVETETFTAVSILQKIYRILKSLGINDVVKLYHDDHLFYQDEKDNANDLDDVMMQYELDTDSVSSVFNSLSMTLEHIHESIQYLIKITVRREHGVGEHPIELKLKGLINMEAYHSSDTEDSPEQFRQYLKMKGNNFIYFLNQFDFAFRRYMSVDDVAIDHDVQMVIIRRDLESPVKNRPGGTSGSFEKEILKDMSFDFDPGEFEKHGIHLSDHIVSAIKDQLGNLKNNMEIKVLSNKSICYTTKSVFIEEFTDTSNGDEEIIIPLLKNIWKK